MPRLLDRAARLTLDLLFPPRCALCGRGDAWLCGACAAALPAADGRRCDICWMPIAADIICEHCAVSAPAFTSLRAACVMDVEARKLTHMLKYEGLTALAPAMAERMAPLAPPDGIDAIVPVPLHAGRRRSRGYNQSEELARNIAAARDLAMEPRLLRRIRATEPLARTMSRDERRSIVAGAFAGDGRAAGRRILLIDDVVTTGATLEACATALLAVGAREVRCLTWTRAD